MAYTILTFDSTGTCTNQDVLSSILAAPPSFRDVFLFSHGWWTTADSARNEYMRFSAGVADFLRTPRPELPSAPQGDQVLALGIHWPSMVSDHPGVFTSIFEAFSYADMRVLAERVATAGIAPLLARVWQLASADHRLRIHLLGHSMGCRVAALGLETALKTASRPGAVPSWAAISPNIEALDVVLFEGAIDNNTLEVAGAYGALGAIPGLRVLVTRSDLDLVLKDYPPDTPGGKAMGAAGPTPATFTDPTSQFVNQLSEAYVRSGSTYAVSAGIPQRFVAADVTQLHQAHGPGPNGEWSGLSGHHSDIYCEEVYELVCGFLFGQR